MSIEPEVMRSCLLDAFSRSPGTQWESLKYDVASVIAERKAGDVQNDGRGGHILYRSDWRRLREALWALIAEGVVVVGKDDSNESWPWLSLTEYGESVVRSDGPLPHDPAGYMRVLGDAGPLSDIERRYITQALESYNRGLPEAASVMLGAASEHLLETFVDAISNSDQAESGAATSALAGPGAGLVRFAQRYFEMRKGRLARELREQLDTTFLGVASVIRMARNDAGHPSLALVSRDQVFVNLQLYAVYRAWLQRAVRELRL